MKERIKNRQRIQLTLSPVTIEVLEETSKKTGIPKSVLIDLAVQEKFKIEDKKQYSEQ